jgi:hypothetical protein
LAVHAARGGRDEDRVPDLVAMQCAAHGHEAVVVVVAVGLLVLVGGSAPDAEPAAAQVARLGEALAGKLSAILAARVCVGVGEGAHP